MMEYDLTKEGGKLRITEDYKCYSKQTRRRWRDYYNHTTWHGIRPLFTSDNILRKTFWFILVLAGLGFMIYFLYLDICLYISRPQQQITKVKGLSHSQVPNIRICPSVPYKLSLANNAASFLTWARVKLNQTSTWNATINDGLLLSKEHANNFRLTFKNDFTFTGGISEYLSVCQIDGKVCDNSNLKWFMNDDGLCIHVDNSGFLMESGWHKDKGMLLVLKNSGIDVFPIQVDLSSGFKISFFYGDDFATGQRPEIVEVGQLKQISLKRVIQATKSSQYPKSDCEDKSLLYNKRYNIENCMTSCRLESFESICGCGWPFIAGSTVPQCSSTEYAYCIDVISANKNLSCDCPPPCNDKTMEIQSTTSGYAVPLAKDLIQDPAITEDRITDYLKRYGLVKIQLDNREIETVIDDSFPFSSFLAHVGGLLGIFLGWSILTFFEAIDVFLRLFDSCCLVTRNKPEDDVYTNNNANNMQLNENGTAHTVNEPINKAGKTGSWNTSRNGILEY